MHTNNLNTVKVIFADSKYNYETNVSANSTEQTASEYFVNKYFDLGIYPKEDMQKCIGIEFTDNNKTQLMRDGIEVLINKIPDDTDLKIGQMVCYQNRSGIYAFLGTITDIYNIEGILNYAINTALGTYLASELRLIKKVFDNMPEFKKGDFAMVVLGSSEDQINGDKVLIDEIIHHNNKTTVNCITTKTKHKFWCHYSDLMPITKI